MLALLFMLASVSTPYHVHWSNIRFSEARNDWVETQTFEADYATLLQARAAARAIARRHRGERTFPADLARYGADGELVTYELFYTGGEHEIRIRDGVVLRHY